MHRLARPFVGFSRNLSTKQGGSPATRAAGAVIDAKLAELTQQLEKEDAYMGPVTESQLASDVEYGSVSHTRPDLDRLRVVPGVMSFYMANPAFEEALRALRSLVDKYTDLPQVKGEIEAVQWIDPSSLYGETKDGLSDPQKQEFHSLLNRLSRIEPQLQSATLRNLLYEMKDKNSVSDNISGSVGGEQSVVSALLKKHLDSLGRSRTVGRRKTATASVWMARAVEGTAGQIFVNNRSIEQYFPSIMQRQELLYPLRVISGFTKFNISAAVSGGGQTSQASALALAIAKGLGIQNPLLISRLREAGCLTTDIRKKERKKPGKAKARKSYGWVKR